MPRVKENPMDETAIESIFLLLHVTLYLDYKKCFFHQNMSLAQQLVFKLSFKCMVDIRTT